MALFTPRWASAQETLDVAHHLDLPQVSVEVANSPREHHFVLGGYSMSLFRAGNLRFPRIGIDWQYRKSTGNRCDCRKDATGHWLVVGGASYILFEGWDDEWDLIFGTSYDLRGERLLNRLAVNVGVSYVFGKTQ
ncbi:MAG: hypothetical protein UY16_C0072G0006 [Candidatus Gottesmanbacteria bacterium GW2011_GWA2_47_9]|uniref:Uncharacterized protein n=1 Tax=Candidatus Gottesmanbacteria bacterium GW2011_GWA2_47_9 TaxID=1618445 RepID=A0A0G1WU32_9BACT|nr:MAG: hypothetical protein UY16_C0072G0006 [Candidatus Gottesmanbacteria bacterium GW2011_GWA2_47_9]